MTGLERKIVDHLQRFPAWASLHELRAVAGGLSDSTLVSQHGAALTAAVKSLRSAGLVETRGGWDSQFQVRAKAVAA